VNVPLRVHRPSPALVISTIALFFAVGGSAFAVGQRVGVAQQRCANGSVKGYAYVTGDPAVGIQNMSESYSTNPRLFSARFDCAGAAVQVRRVHEGFQIKFNGIVARSAVVSGVGVNPQTMTVTALPDGSYRIMPIHPPGGASFEIGPEHQFAVVVF
jgi:hypothetical protein